eukprot:GHVU01011800.1.p2 GENE.GHVU01011800.1~~GHVU01011800.1.p2  ORF type:complete len:102 (+),score=4.64 GHVU01011800.1:592-897(+)
MSRPRACGPGHGAGRLHAVAAGPSAPVTLEVLRTAAAVTRGTITAAAAILIAAATTASAAAVPCCRHRRTHAYVSLSAGESSRELPNYVNQCSALSQQLDK